MGGGFSVVTAVAQVRSLAWELLHAVGVPREKKKKKKELCRMDHFLKIKSHKSIIHIDPTFLPGSKLQCEWKYANVITPTLDASSAISPISLSVFSSA